MAASDNELEKQLTEAGKTLLDPPSSVEELLPLLDEVFQLIVSSFENLTDISSRSYSKRTSILDTVAKVRSCVVMLDLECDALIIEMFQNFLKAIRDHHPDNVFSSMETIMTLVLEESEEISPELLSPILDYVRKDNEVPQISRKLAEEVLKSSAAKLKPYLTDAIKLLGLSLDGYSNVVVSICEGTSNALKQNEAVANESDDKSKLAKVAQIAENGSSVDTNTLKKQDDTNVKDEPEKPDKFGNSEMGNAGDEETDVENKQDQKTKEKGKQSSFVKQEESSKASDVKEETESKASLDRKDGGKCAPSSPPCDSSANVATSDNEKATSTQAFPSKPLADETPNATSPSLSESLLVDSRSKKAVNQKKKETSTKEAKSSADNSAKVVPEEPIHSEAKPAKRSGKKKMASSSKTKPSVLMKKSISETKPAKQSGKKAVDSDNVKVSSKPKEDKKKQGTDEKDQSHTLSDDKEKSSKDEEQPFEETPKTEAKRKLNLDKEKALEDKEFGENLVGAKVKIWWPKDRAYYEGVVDSYDADRKKHLVLYDDGDQERLNLRKEKWEFIEDESESAEMDEKADQMGRDETSAVPQKKKAKTGNDQTAKQTKAESSEKGASSGKSKAATKARKKPEDEKRENKTKDTPKTTRSGKKSEDEKTRHISKETTKEEKEEEDDDEKDDVSDGMSEEEEEKPKTSKSKKEETVTPKSVKTKEDMETLTSKALSKKKEDHPKISSKPNPKTSSSVRGKMGKGTGKANINTSTTSSKAKENEGGEPDMEDGPKAPKTSKGKSAKSKRNSGKKRKR
ncbi:PREDICTED: ABC transporter F family member 4-like isoform X2 [Tarenaya hassleriana]|uniref:ABC transporter F family member 4-like isoform X2 n=1 Tax=Tarenaya hassleriana TaxID=28532 RepID=UPI00053C1415|nr:PREDICTED: ABC transporter F family member 4-like isoform X2 [Tarenaya hassleriana]